MPIKEQTLRLECCRSAMPGEVKKNKCSDDIIFVKLSDLK